MRDHPNVPFFAPDSQKQAVLSADNSIPSHAERLAEALELFAQGQYIQCSQILLPLAEQGNWTARTYLLLSFYRSDQLDFAYEQAQCMAQHGDSHLADWAVYMTGMIEMNWGNYHHAIKIFHSIPQHPRVLLNLALTYWKKYKVYKDRAALDEIPPLLERLEAENISREVHKVPHLKGLVCQAKKEYTPAEEWYQRALRSCPTPLDQASTLNDFAGLYMETGRLDEAERLLLQARDLLLQNRHEFELAVNHRWFGMLAILQNKPGEAKAYIEQAITVFRSKEFLGELAHTSTILDYTVNPPHSTLPPSPPDETEQARMEAAVQYMRQGSYIKAIEQFSFLADRNHPEARRYLAVCYYHLDLPESAYEHFSCLAELDDPYYKEMGLAMTAMLEMTRGEFGEALKRLRMLPDTPRNLVNRALVYYKKYHVTKEEFSIREALRLMKQIRIEGLTAARQQRVYHLLALIYQAQEMCGLAESCYHKALELADTHPVRCSVLNDYASYAMERGDYVKAEERLEQARELVQGQHVIEEALNHKWLGTLAAVRKQYGTARIHYEKAAKVLRDAELLRELASILYVLADAARKDNFYEAAEFFADGLSFEQMAEAVMDRDEKIVRFYHDGFLCRLISLVE